MRGRLAWLWCVPLNEVSHIGPLGPIQEAGGTAICAPQGFQAGTCLLASARSTQLAKPSPSEALACRSLDGDGPRSSLGSTSDQRMMPLLSVMQKSALAPGCQAMPDTVSGVVREATTLLAATSQTLSTRSCPAVAACRPAGRANWGVDACSNRAGQTALARTVCREADGVDGRAVPSRQRKGRLPGQPLIDGDIVVATWDRQQAPVWVPGEQAARCGRRVHLRRQSGGLRLPALAVVGASGSAAQALPWAQPSAAAALPSR